MTVYVPAARLPKAYAPLASVTVLVIPLVTAAFAMALPEEASLTTPEMTPVAATDNEELIWEMDPDATFVVYAPPV